MKNLFDSKLEKWTPEIFLSLCRNYSINSFLCDVKAGLLISVVVFPLFMTFAIASGVSPRIGITTCIIAGSLACLFGGAKFQIVGPTGAFAMIVADIIRDHGFEGMGCALIMAGIMMVLFGIAKMGNLIHYIPYPITAGFTAGIGLSIIVSQLNTFLGLTLGAVCVNFTDKLSCCVANLGSMNLYSFGLAVFSLIFLKIMEKRRPNMPRYFIVLILGMIYSLIFNDVGMETMGSKFGNLSNQLPKFIIPEFTFSLANLKKLFPAAFAIAFLGSLESLLGAVISDNLSGEKHNSNMELIGQGIANLGSAFFGGIPATCALGTTSLNVKIGAKTPVAGLVNVLFISLFILCLKDFVKIIPLSCLSSMLVSVACGMIAFKKNRYIFLAPRSDSFVFISTVLITLLVDIVAAVEIGLVLSAFLFIKRSIETTATEIFSKTIAYKNSGEKECECIKIHGHLFFGAAPILKNALRSLPRTHNVIYMDMQNVPFIDITGINIIKEFISEVKYQNIEVIIGGLNKKTMEVLRKIDTNRELQENLSEI
ncbi:MAG: SulP family inorganic anion transporter [Holosporaceae bacterium]|jgi:SulP family sulfate permease|nr:SulP family inorganic anion transporter [Holosporaceae bacterium]